MTHRTCKVCGRSEPDVSMKLDRLTCRPCSNAKGRERRRISADERRRMPRLCPHCKVLKPKTDFPPNRGVCSACIIEIANHPVHPINEQNQRIPLEMKIKRFRDRLSLMDDLGIDEITETEWGVIWRYPRDEVIETINALEALRKEKVT